MLALPSTGLDWHVEALCLSHPDPGVFFPESYLAPKQAMAEALATCALCPVTDPCLQYAIETNQDEGIWGGVEPKERRKLRRRWMQNKRALV